ncbi:hypothetical protein CJ030_MR5G009657 [Morella rubra]|uniref:Uncharacterized protein n=1 Tax=Morella rubra TaxID=262757 RepID=A0A6A1VN96_9ROSI|nr:hypothetical protein CJ030_MR5G009657 [Morella rubra]
MGSTLLVLHVTFLMLILASTIPENAGRNLLQTDDALEPNNQSDGTVRLDPLDRFKKYRGGYDITNKHYWSSTIFTGVYGYCIGLLWLLCGTIYGGFLLATTVCSRSGTRGKLRKRLPCYKQFCLWPILLVTLLTILAIAASGLVLGGNARFHSQAKTVVNIIINTANKASETIYNTTGAMKDMTNNLEAAGGSSDASGFLNSTSEKLNGEAAEIQWQAKKHRHLINKGLRIVFIIFCWFLMVLCWLFFGMYFFLEKFSSDTCTALENFQQNPNNNSLSSILPCDEIHSAKSILFDVSAGIYNLVNKVNANISLLQATSYPNLVYVCNPFSPPPEYRYQPNNCPANTIKIGDISKVLKLLTCSDSNKGTCENGQFVSTSDFKTAEAYSSSVQTLLNAYPGMESLVECQSVKDAFSEIVLDHCKPLKRYARMVWLSLLFLSMIMTCLVLIWIKQAYHGQNLHFPDSSVKPHFAKANMLEAGVAEESLEENNSRV